MSFRRLAKANLWAGRVAEIQKSNRIPVAERENMGNPVPHFCEHCRKLLTRGGGDQQERLPYYLMDYVWGYSFRELQPAQEVDRFLALLYAIQNQNQGLRIKEEMKA